MSLLFISLCETFAFSVCCSKYVQISVLVFMYLPFSFSLFSEIFAPLSFLLITYNSILASVLMSVLDSIYVSVSLSLSFLKVSPLCLLLLNIYIYIYIYICLCLCPYVSLFMSVSLYYPSERFFLFCSSCSSENICY